jgi:hypothetical protein
VVHHNDPFGHRVGLVHVVRGQYDRHRVRGPHAQDMVPEVRAVLRVEAGGGLVEEQDRRGVDQPDRDVQPPPLAPGQARHLAGSQRCEVEGVEELVGAAAGGAPVEPEHGALRAQFVADPLVMARAVALADVADGAPHRCGRGDDVVAADLGPARRRRDQGGEHAHGRRLARAVGPEHGDELAGCDVEVEPLYGMRRAVAAGEVLGESPSAYRCHAENARSASGHFLSAKQRCESAPTMRMALAHRRDGWHPCLVTAPLPALLLVARRHVDLRRVSSALCR